MAISTADGERNLYIVVITSLTGPPPLWASNADLEKLYYLVRLGYFGELVTSNRALSDLRAEFYAANTNKELPGDTNDDMKRKMLLTGLGYSDPLINSTADLNLEMLATV